jgi:hypothetical protein
VNSKIKIAIIIVLITLSVGISSILYNVLIVLETRNNPINKAPVISNLPDQTVYKDFPLLDAFDLDNYTIDPDSDLLTYSIIGNTNSLCGISIDNESRIDIIPTSDWTGFSNVTIQTSDGKLNASDSFIINVIEVEYFLGIKEGNVFIWEVEKVNITNFNDIFGFEPNFGEGDLCKMIIHDINEDIILWILQAEFWAYGSNWEESGSVVNFRIYKNPANFNDEIFLPIPVSIYLQEIITHFPVEYYLTGMSLFKDGISDTGKDYTWQKEYNTNGAMITESFLDEYDNVIVRLRLL